MLWAVRRHHVPIPSCTVWHSGHAVNQALRLEESSLALDGGAEISVFSRREVLTYRQLQQPHKWRGVVRDKNRLVPCAVTVTAKRSWRIFCRRTGGAWSRRGRTNYRTVTAASRTSCIRQERDCREGTCFRHERSDRLEESLGSI